MLVPYFNCFRLKLPFLHNAHTFLNSAFAYTISTKLGVTLSKFYSTDGSNNNLFDIAIVGSGIVGLGTALELKNRLPEYSICVVDKESRVAFHQSSRNSGVIHAGIYYKPGSLRAKLCVEGLHLMYEYCDKNSIPYKRNGKLIIAVNQKEVKWLEDLFVRAQQNNVPGVELIEGTAIKKYEPYMVGLKAINSPYTGIVNFGDVARHYARSFQMIGGKIILNFKVNQFYQNTEGDGTTKCSSTAYPVTVFAEDKRTVKAGIVLTCAGLHADYVAQLTGESPYPKIMPFRGEYSLLNPKKNCMVNGNVYPVPDPSMPFIGVHFTPKVDGSVWLGPTAMLAYKKEGYKLSEFDLKDVIDMIKFGGLHRFLYKHTRSCIYEIQRSINSKILLKELQMFMPSLRLADIIPGVSVGVQAQAMNLDGTFSEDFGFRQDDDTSRIIHVRNAPSPAATSSLAIAKHLADLVQSKL